MPFRLRSGKALGAGRQEIAIWFNPVPHLPLGREVPQPDVLRLRLDPDHITSELKLNGAGPFELERRALDIGLPPAQLSAYGCCSRRC